MNGFFVHADGEVYAYDYFAANPDTSPPAPSEKSTLAELQARWGTILGPVAKMSTNEVGMLYASLEPIAKGALRRTGTCFDTGTYSYFGYFHDPDTGVYSRVIAAVDGDESLQNVSSAGEMFAETLAAVTGIERICKFPEVICMPQPGTSFCNEDPPECPITTVPSVEGGCWGDCVLASRCKEVEECAPCIDNEYVCLLDGDGEAHCTNWCWGVDPCECETPLCGGGSEYCSKIADSTYQCSEVP